MASQDVHWIHNTSKLPWTAEGSARLNAGRRIIERVFPIRIQAPVKQGPASGEASSSASGPVDLRNFSGQIEPPLTRVSALLSSVHSSTEPVLLIDPLLAPNEEHPAPSISVLQVSKEQSSPGSFRKPAHTLKQIVNFMICPLSCRFEGRR